MVVVGADAANKSWTWALFTLLIATVPKLRNNSWEVACSHATMAAGVMRDASLGVRSMYPSNRFDKVVGSAKVGGGVVLVVEVVGAGVVIGIVVVGATVVLRMVGAMVGTEVGVVVVGDMVVTTVALLVGASVVLLVGSKVVVIVVGRFVAASSSCSCSVLATGVSSLLLLFVVALPLLLSVLLF